ncbi:MAG TPA: hypothetical protein GXZ47_10415 [Treponema sp.]|nr:hypothetical protein [Treponema sp.]
MRKNFDVVILFFAIIMSVSCASQRVLIYNSESAAQFSMREVNVRKINVVVDYIVREEMETEVKNSMFAYLGLQENFSNKDSVYLDISLVERSYFNGIKQIKSLYSTSLFYDHTGQIIGGVSRSIQGKKTIVSSVFLQDQVYRLSCAIHKKFLNSAVLKK